MKVHPAANLFPMMSDDELQALADDIKENGQQRPIAVDNDGQLIDGRNRLAACKLAGVKPLFETITGDPLVYIESANLNRRNLTKGQAAMLAAMLHPEAYSKKNVSETKTFSHARLSQARKVLASNRKIAEAVVRGDTSLDEALATVKELEAQAHSAEEKTEANARELSRLRQIAPDLADQVEAEKLQLNEALAALAERERALTEEQQIVTRGVQQAIVFLYPGGRASEKRGAELAALTNPKFWAHTPYVSLTAQSVERCAEVLHEFAELLKKERKK